MWRHACRRRGTRSLSARSTRAGTASRARAEVSCAAMRRTVAVLVLLACTTRAAPEESALPTGAVRFETPRGPWVVRVEIAATDGTRSRGLMRRRARAPDPGRVL